MKPLLNLLDLEQRNQPFNQNAFFFRSSPIRFMLKKRKLKLKKRHNKLDISYGYPGFIAIIKMSFHSDLSFCFTKKEDCTKKHTKSLTQIWKKESPCGGWTPCPSEPKLGNATTGLQGDSLNRLENLTILTCTGNAVLINSVIFL